MSAAASIPGRIFSWLRHPKTTVRWRLTLLYGGLFLACGAALLAITYTLVEHATISAGPFAQRSVVNVGRGGPPPKPAAVWEKTAPASGSAPGPLKANVPIRGGGGGGAPSAQLKRLPTEIQKIAADPRLGPAVRRLIASSAGQRFIVGVGSAQRFSDLHQLVIESSIALAIMALISGALGWVVAGRVLRPLRTMTNTTQQISEANLDLRLAMDGPRDELRQLADTIDGLLGRLETAFDAQRRFVANASHELRTPLTSARALLEMVLSDPNATIETFRDTCHQVLEENDEQEQLIEALLALAQGQRGIDHREMLDLSEIVGGVVRTREPEAAVQGLRLEVSLDLALVSGDRRLIGRLASNLVDNAVRHNMPSGQVDVAVQDRYGSATLRVSNTGPVIPVDEVGRLLQPFQRLTNERTEPRDGLGLGLSIVAAIASAHGATLDVKPGSLGGLDVEVRFPRVSAGDIVITPPDAEFPQLEPARDRPVSRV